MGTSNLSIEIVEMPKFIDHEEKNKTGNQRSLLETNRQNITIPICRLMRCGNLGSAVACLPQLFTRH